MYFILETGEILIVIAPVSLYVMPFLSSITFTDLSLLEMVTYYSESIRGLLIYQRN